VKSYIRNTINLSYAKIVLPSVIGVNITVVSVIIFDRYSKIISWMSHYTVLHFYILHLLECNTGFFLKFGTSINEVVLNSHMKHRTRPH